MKANAPKKLYLFENPITETPDDRWLSKRSGDTDIEYIRTDAFIEKAIEYIITHIPDMHTLGVSAKMDDCIIKDFRKYMEGE